MREDKVEIDIANQMIRWYNGDREQYEAWLVKPWIWTDRQHINGQYYSPAELIEAGQADEVYRLINFLMPK